MVPDDGSGPLASHSPGAGAVQRSDSPNLYGKTRDETCDRIPRRGRYLMHSIFFGLRIYTVNNRGTWPTSWPKELEPLPASFAHAWLVRSPFRRPLLKSRSPNERTLNPPGRTS